MAGAALEHLSCILRLRGNTINTTPSTQHPQHNIIYTTPSTQHHQYNTINTTPSTQHHLHNIIHTTPSTLRHHILAGAALGALPPYPFCLIPADTPLVILRCGFLLCSVSLAYSTLGCPKTFVNMWGYPVLCCFPQNIFRFQPRLSHVLSSFG